MKNNLNLRTLLLASVIASGATLTGCSSTQTKTENPTPITAEAAEQQQSTPEEQKKGSPLLSITAALLGAALGLALF